MKRVLVTGGNKGIGLAIVKRLVKEYPDVFVYLGSRDVGRGNAAIELIVSEFGQSAKERVKLLELDVTTDVSVQKAFDVVKLDLGSSNDLLYGVVNNAGGGGGSPRQTIELNMYGVRRVTEAFLPLIEDGGILYCFHLFILKLLITDALS
jgi:NAD(P)-dependent dehydrogenase (short-subunit alcohol dehydrogenase family)